MDFMSKKAKAWSIVAGLVLVVGIFGAVTYVHGATAKCVDGTFSYAVIHRGACSWHGGVANWY